MDFHRENGQAVFHRECGREKCFFVENLGENVERAGAVSVLFCGVNIGDDGFDRFGKGVVGFHAVFYFGDAVECGGVVPAAEELACFVQGEAGHAADEVHGDLPGVEDVPASGGTADLVLLQAEVAADLLDDVALGFPQD